MVGGGGGGIFFSECVPPNKKKCVFVKLKKRSMIGIWGNCRSKIFKAKQETNYFFNEFPQAFSKRKKKVGPLGKYPSLSRIQISYKYGYMNKGMRYKFGLSMKCKEFLFRKWCLLLPDTKVSLKYAICITGKTSQNNC